jgi:hypothetical protein
LAVVAQDQIATALDVIQQFEIQTKVSPDAVPKPSPNPKSGDGQSPIQRLLLSAEGPVHLSLIFTVLAVGLLLMAQFQRRQPKRTPEIASEGLRGAEMLALDAGQSAAEKLRLAVIRITEAQQGLAETAGPRPLPAEIDQGGQTGSTWPGLQKAEAPTRSWEQPAPMELTGWQSHPSSVQADGPVADFNHSREMGMNEAEDLFLRKYGDLVRLSCVNLQEHRNPNAVLRFKVDGRGNFMVVCQGSQMLVLPAIGLNPADSRKLLEGVFQYPSERVPVRLASVAKVDTETANTYVIRERGTFERA